MIDHNSASHMNKIVNKIKNLIKFGFISRAGNDAGSYPVSQVKYFNKVSGAEIISPYGLATNLPEKTKLVMFSIMGNEENKVAIGFAQQERFKNLSPGEVVVGSPQTGAYIKFKADGSIEIESKGDLNINASGEVNIIGSQINLGDGGAKIARLGDQVTVGSDTGTITGSGNNTST